MGLLGLSKNLTTLISSSFSEISLFVQYNGYKSSSFLQHPGVGQGSVLGPLFFITNINDLASKLHVPYLLYVDGLKIYHRNDTWEDCFKLQQGINVIIDWVPTNNFSLNKDKWFIVSLEGSHIKRTDTYKGLGVLFCSLNWVWMSRSFSVKNSKYLSYLLQKRI